MEKQLEDLLLQSTLFSNFAREEVTELLEGIDYKITEYKKNDILALRGDRCDRLIIVLSGHFIARMVADSGKFIQIDKIGVGRVLAPAMLFASENIYPVNVSAEKAVISFSMHRNTFLQCMQKHEKLLANFIQIVSDMNRFLSEKIHFLSLKTIRGKIAQYLLDVASAQNNRTVVKLIHSRQELADRFGVSRQSLVRSLSELESEGFISINDKEISLIHIDKLRGIE